VCWLASAGNDPHIARHAVIIGDVHICDRCGIWVGAVVARDISSDSDVAGVPVKVIRTEPGRGSVLGWVAAEEPFACPARGDYEPAGVYVIVGSSEATRVHLPAGATHRMMRGATMGRRLSPTTRGCVWSQKLK